MKVFFPYYLTQKIFIEISEHYAKRFSKYHISKEQIAKQQKEIVMMTRPSMKNDLEKCKLSNGLFIYSMWQGYRDSDYQQKFEKWLKLQGFKSIFLHTSGHAKVSDIRRLIDELNPKKIIPIHTMQPEAFEEYSKKVELKEDGIPFMV